MKRFFLVTALLFFYGIANAQSPQSGRKYPSLLWEISGKGMKKPSYLIGTMHVSSKLAFNLPDSFYYALRSAQVVALETNPETWQEDMSKYDLGGEGRGLYSGMANPYFNPLPDDYLVRSTLKFFPYDNKIERSLFTNPSTINSLLYRTYGNDAADFEEDTYLDMYIYQCGKKWGKRVAGVENYGESMRLMAEAYQDAAKDKTRKERSYDDANGDYSASKLQEAYRSGNLDLLDSINQYNSSSQAFDEKFLYRRNEIQANSIDSILRSGSSLFVGVGAAHLPGERGVIELLRRKGYRLRPVKMGERASKEKDVVDKMRVPVVFHTETAADGLYQVDIPGKFYKFGDDDALDQRQYADMANGSYYIVTRIMTNAWMWNHSGDDVFRKIDSLLYENIPGKIVNKTAITRNGYRGFDITNRTRRGDMQRYQIFITPFEVVFFKMSGNGEYVLGGDEAKRFFGSIQLKEYKPAVAGSWRKYSPSFGGFAAELPHEPFIGNDGSWIFDATDKSTNTWYRVIRTDIHNYKFTGEDSFDLALMDESFRASEFIDSQWSSKPGQWQGYPSLDCRYLDKDSQVYLTRFIIQGPHYYTLVAHGKQELPVMSRFLNSFSLVPFRYKPATEQRDTMLYYSVQTPVFPVSDKIKLDMPQYSFSMNNEDEPADERSRLAAGLLRTRIISSDSTGEKIYVLFAKPGRYDHIKDSSIFSSTQPIDWMGDTTWIVRKRDRLVQPDGTRIFETLLADSGSARMFWRKTILQKGLRYTLMTEIDTLTQPSAFVRSFFDSFNPADTLEGHELFAKKSNLFFADFLSTDSIRHRRAVNAINSVPLDSADLGGIRQLLELVNWKEKNYLEVKGALIAKTGDMPSRAASDFLRSLYDQLTDTVQLQYITLEALLQHKTAYAYNLFRSIVNNEPPVLDDDGAGSAITRLRTYAGDDEEETNGSFMDELYDSLSLTKTILPDLLPLVNLDDYKTPIMYLLARMADSNLLQPGDYEQYQQKFLLEAKQTLRKQVIAEKSKAIEAAEENKKQINELFKLPYPDTGDDDEGNDDLELYAKLLLPFWERNPQVPQFFTKLLQSGDKRLRFNILTMLLDKGRPVPDTLFRYYAARDDYRFELYSVLNQRNQLDRFPDSFNTHILLAKSLLLSRQSYGAPDSLEYADRIAANWKGKNGFIYFFRYKAKKDDLNWKLATVGLVPADPKQFSFKDAASKKPVRYSREISLLLASAEYQFTAMTDTRIREGDVLKKLMEEERKKQYYSHKKSGERFFEEDARRTAINDQLED